MKYTIISLNEKRQAFKDALRNALPYDEIHKDAVDGSKDITDEIEKRGLRWHNWLNAKTGELGSWLSHYDRWALAGRLREPLIVFEDDAILGPGFQYNFDKMVAELPEDWDFLVLWVPDNQRQDYLYDSKYNENGHVQINGFMPSAEQSIYRIPGKEYIALAYQGYGMVALMYSPRGGVKLTHLARSRGIDTPVDCWIFEECHKGNLNGYAPRPEYADIMTYNWDNESQVQQTERVNR